MVKGLFQALKSVSCPENGLREVALRRFPNSSGDLSSTFLFLRYGYEELVFVGISCQG